ncbi:Hypothetical protein A7982_02188 [Minicystis rosea]|nr:Hypothetical protein A7982_02188 [Minicystis rosea]
MAILAFCALPLGLLAACSNTPSSATGGSGGMGTGGAGGGAECPPEGVKKTIGAEGGTITLCGAVVEFPQGALAADTEIAIDTDPNPPSVPFERELASPVFRVAPATAALQKPVSITLPRSSPGSRVQMAVYDETEAAYLTFEACDVTDTTIQQFVGSLGTYTVLRDINDYPSGPSGLGDGTVVLTFLGSTVTYDLDEKGNYGIYTAEADGSRAVTLSILKSVGDGIESLRIDFGAEPGGMAGSLIQVERIATASGAYSYIDGLVGSGGSVTIMETAEGRLVGELAATVHGGDPQQDVPLQATFDVSVGKFAFPPELACPGQGE